MQNNLVVAEYAAPPSMRRRIILHILLFKIISFIDPPPPRNNELETVEQYVSRVEKKYALRELNYYINTYADFDLQKVDQLLSEDISEPERKYFEFCRRMTIKRRTFILLREQIKRESL